MAYEFNGIEYPSVTTITSILDKPALLSWASNCAVDYIQENLDAIKDPIDVHRGEGVLGKQERHTLKRETMQGVKGQKSTRQSSFTFMEKIIPRFLTMRNHRQGSRLSFLGKRRTMSNGWKLNVLSTLRMLDMQDALTLSQWSTGIDT